MMILASSINRAAGAFLHAGYISAAPEPSYLSCNGATRAVDTLQSGVASFVSVDLTSSANGIGDQFAAAAVAGPGWVTLVIGVACFIGALAGLYVLRQYWHGPQPDSS